MENNEFPNNRQDMIHRKYEKLKRDFDNPCCISCGAPIDMSNSTGWNRRLCDSCLREEGCDE